MHVFAGCTYSFLSRLPDGVSTPCSCSLQHPARHSGQPVGHDRRRAVGRPGRPRARRCRERCRPLDERRCGNSWPLFGSLPSVHSSLSHPWAPFRTPGAIPVHRLRIALRTLPLFSLQPGTLGALPALAMPGLLQSTPTALSGRRRHAGGSTTPVYLPLLVLQFCAPAHCPSESGIL